MSEETPDNAHLEGYMRRHVNDRDDISMIEDHVTELLTTPELDDDKHMNDYIRRYCNDI